MFIVCSNEDRKTIIKQGFFAKNGFPGVVGCINCTHPFPFYFVDGSAGYTNGIDFLCNGFPCFSFGFISHIAGKLALQDAFICLHVFCNYCQLSGSKIWFPFSFFCSVCSGMLFRVHVYTDTEKFRPSPLLEDLFLE